MAMAINTDPGFLTLPAEVRVSVYKYLWKETAVSVNSHKIDDEMRVDESVIHHDDCRIWQSTSALLRSSQQIYREALPVYHDLVKLHVPNYDLQSGSFNPVRKAQASGQHVEEIERHHLHQTTFKGFRHVTIRAFYELKHLPVIARQCPDMRSLTFFEDKTLMDCHPGVRNPRDLTIDSVLKTKKHQKELFGSVYHRHERADRNVKVAVRLLKLKSLLQKTESFAHIKDVSMFFKQELQVESWNDECEEDRYDVVSYSDRAQMLRSILISYSLEHWIWSRESYSSRHLKASSRLYRSGTLRTRSEP